MIKPLPPAAPLAPSPEPANKLSLEEVRAIFERVRDDAKEDVARSNMLSAKERSKEWHGNILHIPSDDD